MTATIGGMKKTEQVRLLVETMNRVRKVAPALGETPSEYVNRVVADALQRDLPRAAKILNEEAEQVGAERKPKKSSGKPPPAGQGGA